MMILETKRLILRPLTLADAETAFCGWTGDAEINQWVSWLPHHSVGDAIEWLKQIDWNQTVVDGAPRDNYIWGFVLKETGALFGSGGLIWKADDQLYQIGYNINRSYWNNGYTTEAMRAILDFAANDLGLKRVVGGHAKENLASAKVLEKLGFVYDKDDITPHVDGVRFFDSREYCLDLLRSEKEIEIVKRLAGVNDERRIKVDETGWTSRVYIVDNGKVVFKFPRNKKFRKECKHEVAVLELLKNHPFQVSTPNLNWTAEGNAYFGFCGVEGMPLREIIRTLDDEQKIDIGTQLGVFLKQLHSIKAYDDVKSQTLESQAAEYFEMYQKGRSLLEVFFDEAELESIDDFFKYEVPKCMAGSGELVFCHGDLDYNNTLVDDKNRVGVIDFGDAGLYDRSQDFRGIDDETLLGAMMKAYGGGEIISKEAAEATSKMIDVLNLVYCIENREAEVSEYTARIRERFFYKEL